MAEGFDKLAITRLGRIAYRWRKPSAVLWGVATFYLLCLVFLQLVHHGASSRLFRRWLQTAYEWLGQPAGLDGAFGLDLSKTQMFWVAIFASFILYIAWRESTIAVRPGKLSGPFESWAGLMGAMVLVGLFVGLSTLIVTANTPASSIATSPLSQLQGVRSQLNLYRAQHHGQYPRLDQLWRNLTERTSPDGSVQVNGTCGPYMQQAPISLVTGSSLVAADNRAAWQYDQTTGKIRLVVSPRDVAKLSLGSADAVAAPYDLQPGTLTPASRWSGMRAWLREWVRRVPVCRDWVDGLVIVVIVGAAAIGFRRLIFRWRRTRAPSGSAARVAGLIAIAAVIGLLLLWINGGKWARGSTLYAAHQTGKACLTAALWWAGACLVAMQFTVVDHARHRAGHYCMKCGFDLRGSQAGITNACPGCGKYAPTRIAA